MRPAALLALAALWVAAPAAAFDDWQVEPRTGSCSPGNLKAIEVSLPNILLHEMERIPSAKAQEAARWLASNPQVPLHITFVERDLAAFMERPYEKSPGVLMSYNRGERELHIAHRLLHLDGRSEKGFLQDKDAQRALAHAVATSFVHETSHARLDEALGDHAKFIEDEAIAFYRETLFTLDALRAEPSFNRLAEALALQRRAWGLCQERKKARRASRELAARAAALDKDYTLVVTPPRLAQLSDLAALAAGNDAFEAEALKPYRVPSLWSDSAARVKENRASLERFQGLLDKIVSLGGEAPASSEKTLALIRGDIEFWENPRRLEAARDQVAKALVELKADADRRREAGALKPFAAPPAELEAFCPLDRF